MLRVVVQRHIQLKVLQNMDRFCTKWKNTSCSETNSDFQNSKQEGLAKWVNEPCAKGFEYHCNRTYYTASNKWPGWYKCNDNTEFSRSTKNEFCNGFPNCRDKTDEMQCPNLLYCSSCNVTVFQTKVCDGNFDCPDMTDECQNCTKSHVSNDGYLIGNDFLRVSIVIEILFIITL